MQQINEPPIGQDTLEEIHRRIETFIERSNAIIRAYNRYVEFSKDNTEAMSFVSNLYGWLSMLSDLGDDHAPFFQWHPEEPSRDFIVGRYRPQTDIFGPNGQWLSVAQELARKSEFNLAPGGTAPEIASQRDNLPQPVEPPAGHNGPVPWQNSNPSTFATSHRTTQPSSGATTAAIDPTIGQPTVRTSAPPATFMSLMTGGLPGNWNVGDT